jgi:hypothetical protein
MESSLGGSDLRLHGDGTAAVLHVACVGNFVEVLDWFVNPHRRGVGTRVVDCLIQFCKERPCDLRFLSVDGPAPDGPLPFYERFDDLRYSPADDCVVVGQSLIETGATEPGEALAPAL